MLIAEKKKKENLAEYIVYMYQTEMLIRNFDFNITLIEQHIIANIPEEKLDIQGKQELRAWYQGILEQMIAEGIQNTGHLASVQKQVQKLSDLSVQLLTYDTDYQPIFNEARPAIRENILAAEGKVSDPIQACLNGVFGLMITRMNGKEIPEHVQPQLNHFGNVLSYLSHQIKSHKDNQ